MEEKLVRHIAEKIINQTSRLSLVENKDGFLCQEDTRQRMFAHGVEIIPVSGLDLRIAYELHQYHSEARNVCFVVRDMGAVMPDMRSLLGALYFSLYYDVLSLFDENIVREGISFRQCVYLYAHQPQQHLNAIETRDLLREANDLFGHDLSVQKRAMQELKIQWDSVDTIRNVSSLLCDVLGHDAFDQVRDEIAAINGNFQQYLDKQYAALKNSNAIARPKIVSKVLPHLEKNHSRYEKIALIVVDGMSYWQYCLLRTELERLSMQPSDGFTFSWLPSITCLSRQAIFRGEAPSSTYHQSPDTEASLWSDFWTDPKRSDKRMQFYEVSYEHGNLTNFNSNATRLALVDVELDEFMHSSHHYSDLYSLTQNWAKRIAPDIAKVHSAGYTIYITADHGNLLASPWRMLTTAEKNMTVRSSRGERYMHFKQEDTKQSFIENNADIADNLRQTDTDIMWKNDQCFKNDICITHGGSHFLEVIVPFIKIGI